MQRRPSTCRSNSHWKSPERRRPPAIPGDPRTHPAILRWLARIHLAGLVRRGDECRLRVVSGFPDPWQAKACQASSCAAPRTRGRQLDEEISDGRSTLAQEASVVAK